MIDAKEMANIARSLRESVRTFRRQSTHELPAMSGFISRHIDELMRAAQMLEEAALACPPPKSAPPSQSSE